MVYNKCFFFICYTARYLPTTTLCILFQLLLMKLITLLKSRTRSDFRIRTAVSTGSLVLFFCFGLFAQQATETKSSLDGLASVEWKPVAELNAVLADQAADSEIRLADIQLMADERAVFTLHKRFVSAVMSELQGGSTAFDALSKSYETLVVEIPRDAVMSAAPDGYLDNYVLVIAELLAALPVPRPVTTSN